MMHIGSTPQDDSSPSRLRRRLLCGAGAAIGVAMLAGCGFQLRGTATLPFSSIYVGISDKTELGAQLRRYIKSTTTTQVVEEPSAAQAQLQVLQESRERSILSLDAAGRVRDYELRYLFTFRVHNGKGKDFIPATTIVLTRDQTFSDAATLAKESEANLLYRDMQNEVIQQLLRRMSAIESE